MGISGLLPFIKPVTKKCHIKEFKGESLAIDSFILLHKASLIHGEFEENSGRQRLLSYLTKWLDMFEHFEVTPYFVLDGSALKSKEVTNEARRKARDQLKAEAEKLLAKGRKSEAYEAIRKSRGVTPIMIEIFLNLLKEREIQFVVAPFEADAQLAYLAREKFVKGVVTEDSDLLVFGCPLVIFKLDPEGKCDKVIGDDLFVKKSSPFFNMNLEKMRQICILSGCDYLPNIPSLGLKTSYKLFAELQSLEKVREFLESKDKYKIPPSYWTDFNMANETFLYQKIYCPTGKILKNLNSIEAGVECIEYLRLEETAEEVERFNRIISGECCPKTMVPYNFMPGPTPTIIQPKENPLLRVTSSSTSGPRQTLMNQFTKIEISSTNQDSDNLISNLYKLKGKADSEEIIKKVIEKEKEEEKEEIKEVKTPIKLVSPFFSKGNVSKLIKLSNNNNINDKIKINKGTGEDITLIEVNSSPESNQQSNIIVINEIKEEKVNKEKVIIKEIKPKLVRTIIDVDKISSISKKRQFNQINLIDTDDEEDDFNDFIDEIED